MKNSLYIIAGLLVLLWVIAYLAFDSFRYIDILLPLAAFIVLLRIFYVKRAMKK
ncbi:DUF5670 family protein [Maribellus luteus]|uniref:DUF5670 family protein n=1 Tax=Maribellus luteus TaxID=2305463 RepID=UPI0012D7CFB2|nr:DUF5670 family protein [Maribellus luteus]